MELLQFESNGQRIKIYKGSHAYLDYNFGPTTKWIVKDGKDVEVPTKDYRTSTRYDFCQGSDVPGSSIKVVDGQITGDGRDIGQMIFKERPPKPHPEIQQFYLDNK